MSNFITEYLEWFQGEGEQPQGVIFDPDPTFNPTKELELMDAQTEDET